MMNIQTHPQPGRLRFSVDEYYKLIELGILTDYERAEIIDGELVKKITIGDRHATVVDLLTKFFIKNVSNEIRVGVQNPLRISDYNEPEPDIVLSDLTKYDGERHPRPAEVVLVVKVSDATMKYDRDVKLPLYAEAGIAEVWIVNLRKNIVKIYQNPFDDIYQTVKIFQSGETIEMRMLPESKLEVDELLS